MKKKEKPNMPFYKHHIADCSRCPFCYADNVEGGSFDVNVGTKTSFVVQELRCPVCNKRWSDEFKLVNAVEMQ